MEYFCGICFKPFNDYPELTSNSALDQHLISIHYLPVGQENGKATLEANGLKKNPYKPEIPFTFRRQS